MVKLKVEKTTSFYNAHSDTELIDNYNTTAGIFNNINDINENQESEDAGKITVTGNIDHNSMPDLEREPSANQSKQRCAC